MRNCFSRCFGKKPHSSFNTSTPKGLTTEPDGNELIPKGDLCGLSSISRQLICNSLASVPLFRGILEERPEDLLNELKFVTHPSDTIITLQSSPIPFFFVIESGNSDIIVNGKIVGNASSGYSYGELSLLCILKSTLTLKTASKVKLWSLTRQDFSSLKKSFLTHHKSSCLLLLNEFPLFSHLSQESKSQISEAAFLVNFKEKELICTKGEVSNFLYIIKNGEASVLIDDRVIESFYNGHFFGEMFLVNPEVTKRLATIQCQIDSQVFLVDFQSIKSIVGLNYEKVFLKNIVLNCLTRDEHAKYLQKDKFGEILELFTFRKTPAGAVVIDGSKGIKSSVYVVCFGSVSSMCNTFGDYSLIGFHNENHLKVGTGRYRCDFDSFIAEAKISQIEKTIQTTIEKFVNHAQSLNFIQKNLFFNYFPLNILEKLLFSAKIQDFQKKSWIFQDGQESLFVYFVKTGSVGIFECDNFLHRFDEGSTFGETGIFLDVRVNSAKALTDVTCLLFDKREIQEFLSNDVKNFVDRIAFFEDFFGLKDVSLGSVSTGRDDRDFFVSQLIKKDKKLLVEVVYKKKVKSYDEFQLLLNQKCVLSIINHPHIPRFLRCLSDQDCVYFCYEYLEYMLLNKRKNKKLSEKAAKFIFISIISSIKYLHENGILHRDINPENICLDKEGFVKIIGFKYSKMTDRSYTLLDTRVEYKAVETICTGIYTQASELWSCGVIFYELLRGKSPFGFKDEETYNEKAEKIINFEWKQLSKSVSSKTQSIIKSLLAPKAIQRLKIKEILTDRWSKEFNIDQIFKGIAIPEYKPKDTQLNHSLNMRNSFKPDNRLNAKDKNNKMIFDWDLYF